jgi:long-chain acyl-CoA synthetase
LDFVAFLSIWISGGVVVPVHRSSPAEVLLGINEKSRCPLSLDLLDERLDSGVEVLSGFIGSSEPRGDILDDGALVIFTSGSTGAPKGAVLSHRAFYEKLQQNQALLNVSTETTTLLVLNNTFSFAIWACLMTLMAGGRVVLMAKFTPAAFLGHLANDGINFVGVVPTMIRATFGGVPSAELEDARLRIKKAGALQSVVIGGEPLDKHLSAELRRFLKPAQLYDVYGLTETSTSDFVLHPADYLSHEGSIGNPFPNIQYRIVDDSGNTCPVNVTGELQLKTPFLMKGYLGDPELTEAAFQNGWFKTGDLASVDEQRFVTITGRLKELIVRGGNKITPLEVERALLRCSGVGGVLVTGMPDAILGQRIHALLIPKTDSHINLVLLRQELAGNLERFKVPDVFYVGDALPTGRTGKIDRKQFQQLLASGALSPVGE